MRVTVIDPDRDALDLYQELLEGYGFDVQVHSDALPGIGALIESRPDLIIVDAELDPEREELTGLQVVHSARSGGLQDVPIILCTTATERIAAAFPEVMERGDVHRLEKPFDLPTFERVIQTALGLSRGSARAVRHGRKIASHDREAT